jgi:hypothetical protein
MASSLPRARPGAGAAPQSPCHQGKQTMAVQMKTARTIVPGEVEQVNEKGVKIAGQWWNFSRYHAVPHPYRDELVELTVTAGSNWIEGLVVVEDSKGDRVAAPARRRVARPGRTQRAPAAHSAEHRPRRPDSPSGGAQGGGGLLRRPRGGEGRRHSAAGRELRGVAYAPARRGGGIEGHETAGVAGAATPAVPRQGAR